jgi:hypothetical protein
LRRRSCHERHNRSHVDAARHLLAHVDEAAKSHEKLMEASRQYCTDAVLAEQQCSVIPTLASFSSYCQRSVGAYKMFGDCLSVNTVDQLRTTRKTNKAVSLSQVCSGYTRWWCSNVNSDIQEFDEAMKSYKSTEQEVGKKDKKLKDIENSKSAANQRSAIDTLSRQLQDERKASTTLRTDFWWLLDPLCSCDTLLVVQALGSMRENVVQVSQSLCQITWQSTREFCYPVPLPMCLQVGQRCVSEHEKGTKAAVLSFLHSTMAHHAIMLQLATEAYQEVSKLPWIVGETTCNPYKKNIFVTLSLWLKITKS